jgi:dTDP-4-dehydrorhamnose reductase
LRVAGGQGRVGCALAQQGLDQNLDLIALGRQDLDITSSESIAAVFAKYEPDLLINAAAYTDVDKAESEPELAYATNEAATALLADACFERGIPMLHTSTDYVYDGTYDSPYVEADAVNPIAFYVKSKEAGERALRKRLERHIILRTIWVFDFQGNNFVKTMVRLEKDQDRLTVVADQICGPSSARGIAKALLTIAKQYQISSSIVWGTYHYCQKPY